MGCRFLHVLASVNGDVTCARRDPLSRGQQSYLLGRIGNQTDETVIISPYMYVEVPITRGSVAKRH